MTHGLPGVLGVDHIGITVPDMEQAADFFVRILGGVEVYTLPGKRSDDTDWMTVQLGVLPRTTIDEIRFFRLGNGANFEVFTYTAEGQAQQVPLNSDIGGHHVALYVEDMDVAAAYLRENGVEVMGEPVASANAAAGQRWLYFRAPWGLQFELVSYPGGKAYESTAPVKLWQPVRDED